MIVNSFIVSTSAPNPKEFKYWADLNADKYGGIIKYFNGEKWIPLYSKIEVIDNLTTDSKDKALSAKQGKALKDAIDQLTKRIEALEKPTPQKAITR